MKFKFYLFHHLYFIFLVNVVYFIMKFYINIIHINLHKYKLWGNSRFYYNLVYVLPYIPNLSWSWVYKAIFLFSLIAIKFLYDVQYEFSSIYAIWFMFSNIANIFKLKKWKNLYTISILQLTFYYYFADTIDWCLYPQHILF